MTNSQERRPAVSHEAAKSIRPDTGNPSSTHRKTWARALIDNGVAPIQVYGSPEWCALPLDHPNRVAATAIAAELHREYWYEGLEDRLTRQAADERTAHKRAEDEEYVRQWQEHRKAHEGKYGRVLTSFEQRRADQLEAAKPRPGDFKGRNGGGAS